MALETKEKNKSDSVVGKFIPNSEDSGGEKAKKIIILVVMLALIALLIYFVVFLLIPEDEQLSEEEIKASEETVVITMEETTAVTEETVVTTAETTVTTEETTTTTPEPEPLVMREEIKEYYNQNEDTAGWIKIGGTSINSVVVQGEDNDFYLDHSFYGGSSHAGTLYADYRCVVNDYAFNQTDNIIIYGHNQADGTMFGTLQYYKIKSTNTSRFDFYKEHPTFTFSNLYEEYTYKIVAMFVSEASASQAPDGVIFDAHNYVKFNDGKRSFENFVKNINERTAVLTGVDMQEGDQFMTLSTCSNEFNNSRFIVIGRKVRPGESPEVDTSLAQLNPDAKEPDLDFIYGR
ncbi:MAG: class B sortase [Oscillospiraceae bacterium]|nr:class B sortase [Oscillospiraceae bacterium]